jgi:hypothetical protein
MKLHLWNCCYNSGAFGYFAAKGNPLCILFLGILILSIFLLKKEIDHKIWLSQITFRERNR